MKSIGTSVRRVDAAEKVTGRARYASDVRFDGLLVALALRATTAPGRIRRIDCSRAAKLPGIAGIFTHLDADRLGWTNTPDITALGAEWLGRPALGEAAVALPAYRPIHGDDIFFAGQWIAVVVAESYEQARVALGDIVVDIEITTLSDSPPMWPGHFFAADMQYCREIDLGAGSERFFLRATYTTPMELHQPMEPTATTAAWEDNKLTLYDSTQGVQATRDYVAASLDVPASDVRVLSPHVGGGFGAKNQVWPHQALAAHLARVLRRPVRLQLTRADMAVASGYRSETEQEIELSADAEGRLKLLRHASEVPTSLRGGFFEPCGLNSMVLYRTEKMEVVHKVVRRPVATPTPFRAPGETPGSFALETALDELAHQMRIDPLELRVRNFAERDFYHDRDWSSNNLLECYRIGAERFGWPGRYVPPRAMRRDGRLVGYGMGTTAYPAQALAASVRLVLKRAARLIVETSAIDIGNGMRTVLAQAVAEGMQIDPEHIDVRLGDSSLPPSLTAGRSRSTASVLPAAIEACRALKRELDRVDPLDEDAANLTGPMERLDRSGESEISVTARSGGAPAHLPLSFYSFGCHFVEIELDELIGRVRVRRVVSAMDCGRIINPRLAESQIRGSVIFGIGMALMEEAARHPETLRVLSDNLADYAVPVHADIPDIDVMFVDKPDRALGELGARGLGEIGLPGVAAAIGNAVFSAAGRRCRSLPIPLSHLQGDSHNRTRKLEVPT